MSDLVATVIKHYVRTEGWKILAEQNSWLLFNHVFEFDKNLARISFQNMFEVIEAVVIEELVRSD